MRIQGIKKYNDLESYIGKAIVNNKELLEDIIGINIKNLFMEVRINKKRVDLVGQIEDGSLVLGEISVRHNNLNDFQVHRKQIISILEFAGEDKFVQVIFIVYTVLE